VIDNELVDGSNALKAAARIIDDEPRSKSTTPANREFLGLRFSRKATSRGQRVTGEALGSSRGESSEG
jgi:hypothetical protein